MKLLKALTIACTCGIIFTAAAQKETKLIKKENVARVIKMLTTDEMMGRPASDPSKIEKATSFIEGEFKSIGLNPITGLNSYRQEFFKEKIITETVEVTINGEAVPGRNAIVYSEKSEISFSSELLVKKVEFDSTVKTARQFFGKVGPFLRDTTNMLIAISSGYEDQFSELKSYFKTRFVSNRKGSKIFVLGDSVPDTYSIKAKQKIESIKMNNVAGMLPGKTKPDEFVIFSAHYDHIGIMKPVAGDSIANGADDDASGTTAVIELARYFKEINDNNRTLIFVTFTAEEIGGFGSRYFSEQMNPDKVVAMFNIEMIGKPSKFGQNAAFITGYERSDFGEILQKNLTGTPFQFKPDPYPEQNLFYRSDNATLARLGVPAHSISTDQIDIDKLYHSVDDELESLDIDNIVSTIRAIALSSKTIVNGTDTPKRIDKTQVTR